MADRLWCPTRGYFTIGEGGAPAQPAAGATDETAETAASPAEEASEAPPETAPAAAAAGDGARVWAPTRGYFTIGGAAPPAAKPAAPAPEKAAAEKAAPAPAKPAPEKGAPAAEKKAAPAPKTAVKKAAKPAAATAGAAAGKKKPPAPDPERESVTTVPTVTESPAFTDASKVVYDEPDSETTLYKVTTLNAAFAISSALLLLWLVLVLWQDYDREWKHIQDDFQAELAEEYRSDLYEVSGSRFEELRGLEEPLRSMLEELGASVPSLRKLPVDGEPGSYGRHDYARFLVEAERVDRLIRRVHDALGDDERHQEFLAARDDAANEANLADRDLRFWRGDVQARLSKIRKEKEEIVRRYGESSEALRALEAKEREHIERWAAETERLAQRHERLQRRAEEAAEAYESYIARRTGVGADSPVSLRDVENRREVLGHAVTLEEKKISEVEESWQNAFRDALLLDFLRPTLTIDKVVVDDLYEDLNFLNVPRVDRCKTCHVNIDSPDPRFVNFHSEKWGSVYASHPRLDLYLLGTTPHPYEEFGCTGCHYGAGRETDFTLAAHVPASHEEEDVWKEKYDWHELHHEDYPMYGEQFLTVSCRKCHDREDHIDGADKLNLGMEIVRNYGCFGCHRIDGYDVLLGEADEREELWKRNKAGPSLRHIADKTTPEFLYKWIRNPWAFRPSTNMPRFFDLTNNRGEMVIHGPKVYEGDEDDGEVPIEVLDFGIRNDVEALALATYIHRQSEPRPPLVQVPEVEGDPARGRDLFQSLGCLGCHSVKVESMNPDAESPEPRLLNRRLRAAASALEEGAGGQGRTEARRLAELYREVARGLEETAEWFVKLTLDRDLPTLYHRIMSPLVRAEKLEEGVGVSESPLPPARALADSYYDRWAHNTFAPDLSSIGSKFDLATEAGRSQAKQWLTDWIVHPQMHDPETTMPRFRLEEDRDAPQKLADLVAYLLTLRDPEFESLPSFTPDDLSAEHEKVLDELVFTHMRGNHATWEAAELVDAMSREEKLLYTGHRLIRRYGCFGCHNGIVDRDPDPAAAPREVNGGPPIAYFDQAQNIGTELNGWGNKPADRLDYGPWGHQSDGSWAIAHNRFDWLEKKLQDTRRYDVFPVERTKVVHGRKVRVWEPTNRLIQKRPDELLKMPLFPFHDNETMVEAAVTFVTSLVNDHIPLSKKHRLLGRKETIELGGRLVKKYNCDGCHRVGAERRTLALAELPSFAGYDDEDIRYAEMQKETWLAEDFVVERPQPPGSELDGKVLLPAGFLLPLGVLDPAIDPASERASEVYPISVVQAVHRHYDPLPAFIQAVLQTLDIYAIEELLDKDILAFVRALQAEDPPGELASFVEEMKDAAFDQPDRYPDLNAFLTRALEQPYHPEVLATLESQVGRRHQWERLAKRFYGRELRRIPEAEQRLPVRGFGEGRIRRYFGTDAESRANAPPPLARQGERVRSEWLFEFLLDVEPIRPWLKVRMPSFPLTQTEARAIVAWFKALYGVPEANELFDEDRLMAAHARAGAQLFNEGFECYKCHIAGKSLPTLPILEHSEGLSPEDIPIDAPGDSFFIAWKGPDGSVQVRGGFPDAPSARAAAEELDARSWAVGQPWNKSTWAPDLGKARERLRPDWVRDWLISPKDFMPGTKMPAFFGTREKFTGEADSEVTPEREQQIQKLLQYLMHLDEVGSDAQAAVERESGEARGG